MVKDYKTIHEDGFLQDILNVMSGSDRSTFGFINDIADKILGKAIVDPNNVNISRNIAKSASALTATFPVIVTEATQLDHATMVSKAIERKAVAMLQMLFAANQITNATSAMNYLKRFHNNLDASLDLSDMDVDDVIEYSNKLTESVEDPTDYAHAASVQEAINIVLDDTKYNIHHHLNEEVNPVSIEEYRIYKNPNKPLAEAEIYRSGNRTSTRTTYDGPPGGIFTQTRTEYTVQSPDDFSAKDLKDAYDAINKGVIKTDIQKANEAVPSMIIVNFVSIIPGQNTDQKVVSTAVIGVKAVLHYVPSEEMMNRLMMKNADRHGLLNFLRATTREISFFKDFLFAVNRAKIDAVSKSGKGSNSKIWKLLELRADKAKLNRASGRNNTDCAAITSIIISSAEVELMKKYHRIDLMKIGTLVGIMRGYSIMCAVIVDEVAERVDFLFDDNEKKFETLSFMSLEREENAGNLKKVINIMAAKGR